MDAALIATTSNPGSGWYNCAPVIWLVRGAACEQLDHGTARLRRRKMDVYPFDGGAVERLHELKILESAK